MKKLLVATALFSVAGIAAAETTTTKVYFTTDDSVTAQVRTAAATAPLTSDDYVTVSNNGLGDLVITGTVDSLADSGQAMMRAYSVARSTTGVSSITNKMIIANDPEVSAGMTEAEFARFEAERR